MHTPIKPVLALAALLAGLAGAEPLQVASLHPVVSDLARQVGGDDVVVTDLMPAGANPHAYYPSPADLKRAANADLVLAAGKGLEPYLDEFRESLGGDVTILEVGRAVPSLLIEAGAVFVCCPSHAHGAVDPHWWHSIHGARRASLSIADALAERRPDRADAIQARYRTYAEQLKDLHRWAKREIGTIPRRDRELTTSHAAFGYMCTELGLRSITVQGLTTEDDPKPGYLKDVVKTLRKNEVRAIFAEEKANPKILNSMVKETGVVLGGTLVADSLSERVPTYEALIRSNVTSIVKGLRGAE